MTVVHPKKLMTFAAHPGSVALNHGDHALQVVPRLDAGGKRIGDHRDRAGAVRAGAGALVATKAAAWKRMWQGPAARS